MLSVTLIKLYQAVSLIYAILAFTRPIRFPEIVISPLNEFGPIVTSANEIQSFQRR